MRYEYIVDTDLFRREVYTFSLWAGVVKPELYFDSYRYQERKSSRHKWVTAVVWERLDQRQKDIDTEIAVGNLRASDAEANAKLYFENVIQDLSIIY